MPSLNKWRLELKFTAWHVTVAENPRSHYEDRSAARGPLKQPLLVFPELLDELSHSWADRPFSGRNTFPR